MFPLIEDEKNTINEDHLEILYDVFMGNDIGTGQTILFDIYDFSIIPVELISNIYETFLNRKSKNSNKPYYTPLFLVDYVLNNSLDEMLKDGFSSNCKVLDPACGSGIFLVESLRRLIDKKREVKSKLENEDLKKIVLDNVFGIDKDEDAIHLSIFSIYLTLLDYLESMDIEKFDFPKLKNKNLFVSDFFDLKSDFNSKIKNIDLIVGNPPWGSVNGPHIDYCKKNHIPLSYKQIAQSFLVRVQDFATPNTKIALIVTSKILYNITGKEFRKYFLENFAIDRIMEFSSIRRKVFKNAIGPGAIIFYRFVHNQNTKDNIVEHISLKPNRFFDLFQAVVIEKYDMKHIQQNYFMDYDWIWKVILYGNILDFKFIKRLKNNFKPIKKYIEENKGIQIGFGVQLPSNDMLPKFKSTHLVNRPYLDTKKGILKRYFTDIENASKWKKKYFRRPRDKKLFEPPYILVNKYLNKDFQSVAAFSDQKWAFTDSVIAIKDRNCDINKLKSFLGLLNSKLFTYYIFLIGSLTGTERAQIYNPKRFSFPAIIDDKISQKVEQLEQAHEIMNENGDMKKNKQIITKLENELDEIIFNLYELDGIERDLIDYLFDVSIPLFKGKKKLFEPPDENQLIEYARVFLEHFERRINGPNEFFCIEIYSIDYFVAMNFKIVKTKPEIPINFIQDASIDRIIRSLGDISLERMMKDMYVQRDIKGFEKTSFYIIKLNEYKNWHKTIARLDLSEFIDAMVKADLERIKMETQLC